MAKNKKKANKSQRHGLDTDVPPTPISATNGPDEPTEKAEIVDIPSHTTPHVMTIPSSPIVQPASTMDEQAHQSQVSSTTTEAGIATPPPEETSVDNGDYEREQTQLDLESYQGATSEQQLNQPEAGHQNGDAFANPEPVSQITSDDVQATVPQDSSVADTAEITPAPEILEEQNQTEPQENEASGVGEEAVEEAATMTGEDTHPAEGDAQEEFVDVPEQTSTGEDGHETPIALRDLEQEVQNDQQHHEAISLEEEPAGAQAHVVQEACQPVKDDVQVQIADAQQQGSEGEEVHGISTVPENLEEAEKSHKEPFTAEAEALEAEVPVTEGDTHAIEDETQKQTSDAQDQGCYDTSNQTTRTATEDLEEQAHGTLNMGEDLSKDEQLIIDESTISVREDEQIATAEQNTEVQQQGSVDENTQAVPIAFEDPGDDQNQHKEIPVTAEREVISAEGKTPTAEKRIHPIDGEEPIVVHEHEAIGENVQISPTVPEERDEQNQNELQEEHPDVGLGTTEGEAIVAEEIDNSSEGRNLVGEEVSDSGERGFAIEETALPEDAENSMSQSGEHDQQQLPEDAQIIPDQPLSSEQTTAFDDHNLTQDPMPEEGQLEDKQYIDDGHENELEGIQQPDADFTLPFEDGKHREVPEEPAYQTGQLPGGEENPSVEVEQFTVEADQQTVDEDRRADEPHAREKHVSEPGAEIMEEAGDGEQEPHPSDDVQPTDEELDAGHVNAGDQEVEATQPEENSGDHDQYFDAEEQQPIATDTGQPEGQWNIPEYSPLDGHGLQIIVEGPEEEHVDYQLQLKQENAVQEVADPPSSPRFETSVSESEDDRDDTTEHATVDEMQRLRDGAVFDLSAKDVASKDVLAVADLFANMKSTLATMSSAFDRLGAQSEKMASIGHDAKAIQQFQRIRSTLAVQISRQRAQVESLKSSLQAKIKASVETKIREQLTDVIRSSLQATVEERVRQELSTQIPDELRKQVISHKRHILEVRASLHNSEARRYNALQTMPDLNAPLRPLLRPLPTPEQSPVVISISRSSSMGYSTLPTPATAFPQGPAPTPIKRTASNSLRPPMSETVPPSPSPFFPRDMTSLFALSAEETKRLLREYGLTSAATSPTVERPMRARGLSVVNEDAAEEDPDVHARDLNKFMAHIGVPFLMIPAPKEKHHETAPLSSRSRRRLLTPLIIK